MKKIMVVILVLLNAYTGFSQIKLIHGVVKSETDSLPVDSALVILQQSSYNSDYRDDVERRSTMFYASTDSTGRFEFRNLFIPGLNLEDTNSYWRLNIQVLRNNYYEYYDNIEITNDSILDLTYYLSGPDTVEKVDTTRVPESPAKPYEEYTTFAMFAGTQFDPSGNYQSNYKAGIAIQAHFKISPINYFALDIMPLIYRRYNVAHDSINTTAVYNKEYFSSLQYGLGVYFRTHIFSWNKKKNALFLDIGAEYDFPWYYRYINKPDRDTKFSFKHFHKYNEFYANAKLGILKGCSLKGQYRLTDIFKGPYEELPRWSLELQLTFMISDN